MKTTTYLMPRFDTATPAEARRAEAMHRITLPAVPGVIITSDRADTAPRQPIIKHKCAKPQGVARAALDARRVDALTHAILAARAEITLDVTLSMRGLGA